MSCSRQRAEDLEQGGKAVCVQSNLTTTGESGEVTDEQAVECVRIQWGSKYLKNGGRGFSSSVGDGW